MATKRIWVGSVGPYLYDDSTTDKSGRERAGLRTEGKIIVEGAPINDDDGVRLQDLNLVADEAYSQLVVATSINLGTGGSATENLLTVPAAKELLPLRVIVVVRTLSGVVGTVPIISLGKSTDATAYMTAEEMFGLTAVSKANARMLGGTAPILVAADILMLTVDTQADIVTFSTDLYVYGATL